MSAEKRWERKPGWTCGHCAQSVTEEHAVVMVYEADEDNPACTRVEYVDPCLGVLPGVAFACCGHGGNGYIAFENGTTVDLHVNKVTGHPGWSPGRRFDAHPPIVMVGGDE